MNPVLAREGRQRFRSSRAAFAMTAWVGLIGALTFLLYALAQEISASSFGVGRLAATAFMGRFMFHSITLLLLTAIIMVVPGIAAPSIVGERERQTFQILQVTQMTPWRLVVGKLAASVSFALVLLAAVAPVAAIPLLFGGVAISDVLAALGMLFLTAVMLAALSTWMSSRAQSTRGAVAMSYLLAFGLAFLTFAALAVEMLVYSRFFEADPFASGGREVFSILANPYFGLVDAIQAPIGAAPFTGDTPFVPFDYLLHLRQGIGDPNLGVGVQAGGEQVAGERISLWVVTVVVYLAITALSLARAAANVRAPSARIRLTRRREGADA